MQCSRCKTRPGFLVNPNDPTATNDIPFGPPIPLKPIFRTGDQTATESQDALSGWNWGAALLPTLWSARHQLKWLAAGSGLLTLLLGALYLVRASLARTPDAGGTLTGFLVVCALIFGVPRSLYLARHGNTLALRSGIYPDNASLLRAQRRWALWAIIVVTITALILGFAAALLGAP
jgi:hypothetical protein